MHSNDVQHRLAVHFIAREWPHAFRNSRRLRVRFAAHQRRNRPGHISPFVGIVRQRHGHQQRAKIRVTQPERPEVMRILRNLRRRVTRVVHQDFLRRNRYVHCMLERRHIELPAGVDVLHQIQRSQVARRVIQEHVFAARIRGVDSRGALARVPAVHRRVVLHPRIAAVPRRIRNLHHQVARPQLFIRLPVEHVLRPPILVLHHRAHEIVRHAH